MVRDQTGLAFHWARELARKAAEDQDARKRYIVQKRTFASGVEAFAKVDPQVAVTADHWDRDPWLLGTPGGTVDLRTGKIRKSERKDGITRVTLVAPSANGCPRWLQFLRDATGNDEDLIRFLQQWFGYCLTGVTDRACAAVCLRRRWKWQVGLPEHHCLDPEGLRRYVRHGDLYRVQ